VPHGLTFDAEENGAQRCQCACQRGLETGCSALRHVMITDLIVENGRTFGARGIDLNEDEQIFQAEAVVLAAGGANRIFPNVVPRIADKKFRTTGDGLVLALRAGVNLVDMEMANFRNSPPASRFGARYIMRGVMRS